jgi:biotin operon repressor
MTNYLIVNGRKFVWDGQAGLSKEAVEQVVSRYRSEGFETETVEEEGKFLAYTRRGVKTAAVEQPG